MGSLSAGEMIALAIGGILAVSGAISTVGGAIEKIAKAVRVVKAPEEAQNGEIEKVKVRLDKLEISLKKDEGKIEASKECNRVLTKGMLALLEHGINGNNIDQMRDAKKDVEAYLISH